MEAVILIRVISLSCLIVTLGISLYWSLRPSAYRRGMSILSAAIFALALRVVDTLLEQLGIAFTTPIQDVLIVLALSVLMLMSEFEMVRGMRRRDQAADRLEKLVNKRASELEKLNKWNPIREQSR